MHQERLARAAEQLLTLKSEENTKLNLNGDYVVDKKKAFPALSGAQSTDESTGDRVGQKPDDAKKQTAKRPFPTRLDRNDKYVHKPNAWEVRALEIARRLRRRYNHPADAHLKDGVEKNVTLARLAEATFLAFEKRVRAVKAIDQLRKHKYDHGALRDFATSAYVESFQAIREVFKLNKVVNNVTMPSMGAYKKMRFRQALSGEKMNLKMLTKEKPGGFCREQPTRHACLQMTHLFEVSAMDGAPCSWCVLPRGSGGPKGFCEFIKEANKLTPLGWTCEPLTLPAGHGVTPEQPNPIQEMREDHELPPRHSDSPRLERDGDVPEAPEAGADQELAKQFSDDMAQEVVSDAVRKVHLNTVLMLRKNINVSAIQKAGPLITAQVVSNVVPRVTQALAAVLTESITRVAANGISANLIPSLTHSITATISQSLTRSPRTDFYCWYCKHEKVYCSYCHAGMTAASATDYYGSYYAEYYSRYYAYWYGSVLGDGFVDDVLGL